MKSIDERKRKTVVRFFGPLEEVLGAPEKTVALGYPQTEGALRSLLEAAFPRLKGQVFSIAVDQVIVAEGQTVTEAREIALLPPFAGG